VRPVLLALAMLLSQGWFTARYLLQAARGQLELSLAARPLERALADPATPARTRRLLAAIPAIKAFGREHGLSPTGSYQRYAALPRPAAAWVVQACAPLSFEVRRWTFPVVGSVPYLGFFEEGAARRYGAALAAGEGLDVDVRTAEAFSTLGWFRDPVLSTMLGTGPEALGDLASLVLHESVHATVYVAGQSAFDESLASFVADRLAPAWLERQGPGSAEATAWSAAQAARRARLARLRRAHQELDALYRSVAPDAEKAAGKARLLSALQRDLGAVRPLNNAALAGYRAYDTGEAAFRRALDACGGSFPRLLAALGRLGPGDFARPQQEALDDVIDRAARAGCAGDP
jgi:predicted aminopeptidase